MRKIIFILIALIMFIQEGSAADMDSISQFLPETINEWNLSSEVQKIDSTNIFDYMNGGGELYLSYRFKFLEVFEYLSKNNSNILVEIYEMETEDDAFGLLSLDWSGEPVSLGQPDKIKINIPTSVRALYGRGLLRMVSGKYYVRIMAAKEAVETKDAVVQIGRALYNDTFSEPEIIKWLPSLDTINWNLNFNEISFFRSHMVLNSLFYLSHQNILDLNLSSEAVTATYESTSEYNQSKPIRMILINYGNAGKAINALFHFYEAFLSELKIKIKLQGSSYINYNLIEDGWLACKLENNFLVLLFNVPNKKLAEQIINHIQFNKADGE